MEPHGFFHYITGSRNVILSLKSKCKRTFWSSGAEEVMSSIRMGISSLTLTTPAAKVPSGATVLMF